MRVRGMYEDAVTRDAGGCGDRGECLLEEGVCKVKVIYGIDESRVFSVRDSHALDAQRIEDLCCVAF